MTSSFPYLGYGVGLRSQHFQHILENKPAVDWFEIISENFMDSEGWPRHVVRKIAERYPVVMHGVSMSIGSTDPLNETYLKRLKTLASELNARWISDHLCWTGVLGKNTHDLLPLPLNAESLNHVVERIGRVQDILGRQLVLENPSSYMQFTDDSISECSFIAEMAERADCKLLLDINNVYVSAFNHGFDPVEYINTLPLHRVVQFHLAGHTNNGTHIIDTHDDHVVKPVWELYAKTIEQTGSVSTLLEWDGNIPDFEVLTAEVFKAKSIFEGGPIPDSDPLKTKAPTVPAALHTNETIWEQR